MKKLQLFGFFLFALIFLTGCNHTANELNTIVSQPPYGFLSGVWHGFSSIPSFIASLFGYKTWLYAEQNDGVPYLAGFMLGIYIFYEMITD